MLTKDTTTAQESRVRRLARREGYTVRRSRERKHVPNIDNHGEFMLIESDRNIPALGWRHDATLDEIDAFLSED
jgi:hypothetical protein